MSESTFRDHLEEGEGCCGGECGCTVACANCACQHPADPFTCPGCGNHFSLGDNYCSVCGRMLVDEDLVRDMRVCLSCGEEASFEDTSCSNCDGSGVVPPAEALFSQGGEGGLRCQSCGSSLETWDLFCPRCGISLRGGGESIVDAAAALAGDGGPEQEHFITASLQSDDPERVASAVEDLTAMEEGRSTDPLGYPEEEDPLAGDDPAWCDDCNRDIAFCLCICHYCYERVEGCTCPKGGKCHACGADLGAEDLYCGDCGAAVSPSSDAG